MSLSAYELERLENIRRNNAQLAYLGLADGIVPSVQPPARVKRKASQPNQSLLEPPRRSSRLQEMPAPDIYVAEDPDDDDHQHPRKTRKRSSLPIIIGGEDAQVAAQPAEEGALPIEGEIGVRLSHLERQVYEAIREVRNAKARSMARSMFIVCSNRTMLEMCKQVPSTLDELLHLYGMGELKVQRYGTLLLETLAPYAEALRDEHAASEAAEAAEAAAAPTALLAPSPPSLEEADGGAPGELTSSVLPQSIDEVIRYMDERAPLARYYERQADSAGGCSRTRSKLRAHAKLHPNDPAVAFWVAAGGGGGRVVPWMPPDAHSLEALVNLLKQIIGPP